MQIDKVSFKSNSVNIAPKAEVKQAQPSAAPAQNEIPMQTPDYNVTTPIAYGYYGEVKLPNDLTAHLYKLGNGQKVIVVPKEGTTVVKTYVNSGSMNEPDHLRGISHFIEHNLFNGSEGLEAGQFFKDVDKMGASTNASTGFAETNYYIQSNLLDKNDLETKIKMHASMLQSPRFAVNMLEKERGPVNSEINMINDDIENIAINETIKTLYNIKSTSRDLVGGSVENINAITRDDVIDYYKKNYNPQTMTTVITGDVTPEETIRLISKHFRQTNTPIEERTYENFEPIDKTVRKDITSPKAAGTSVLLGFDGVANNNAKDKVVFDVLSALLTGTPAARLNKSLEEIHTAAEIQSERISTKPKDGRLNLISVKTTEENSQKALQKVYDEIYKLQTTPPDEEELKEVKNALKTGFSTLLEKSENINTLIGQSMLEGDLSNIAAYNEYIEQITPQDISAAAKKYLNINKAAITVVHPQKSVSFTGSLDKVAIDTNKINQYKLPNNIQVATTYTSSAVTTLGLNLRTQAPANVTPVVTQLLTIMLNRGNAQKTNEEFSKLMQKEGANIVFSASTSGIEAVFTAPQTNSLNTLKMLNETVYAPRFTKEDFEHAKQTLEIALENSQITPFDKLNKVIYEGLPTSTKEEMLKELQSIKLEEVVGLYQYIMQNAQADVSAAAKNDVTKDILTELAALPAVKPHKFILFDCYRPLAENKFITETDDRNQADIVVAYKFKHSGNIKDTVSMEILNTILGGTPSSRLFNDLRETQKLAYRVNSTLDTRGNIGTIMLRILTTTDSAETGEKSFENVEKSLNGFKTHVDKLKTEHISVNELENAKRTFKNKILSEAETSGGKTDLIAIGQNSAYDVDYTNKLLKAVDELTVEDIYNAANYAFAGNSVTSIVASKDTIDWINCK